MPSPSPAALDITSRRVELERMGFTVVDEATDGFTAARYRLREDLRGLHETKVVRVRRVGHLTADQLRSDQAALRTDAANLDPEQFQSPGLGKYQSLVLFYLADSADAEARSRASGPPIVDFSNIQAAAILEATGEQSWCSRVYLVGAAQQPGLHWIIRRVLSPGTDDSSEPVSRLAIASSRFWTYRLALILGSIGLLLFVYSVLVCCSGVVMFAALVLFG